jgi:pyrroloquinoline quinone biosynthesis protein B
LLYRAIELGGDPPPFAKAAPRGAAQSVAYQFKDPRTGGRLLVAPDVGGLNDGLREALSCSDAVLFDGTFWSGEELRGVKSNAPKASEMGHVTIEDCSLRLLSQLAARRKIYIHINNTNPILAPGSPERAAVESAGVVVGSDGLEFEL